MSVFRRKDPSAAVAVAGVAKWSGDSLLSISLHLSHNIPSFSSSLSNKIFRDHLMTRCQPGRKTPPSSILGLKRLAAGQKQEK